MARKKGYIEGDESLEERKSFTKLTRWEMETTVNFNAEEGTAVLYTRDKAVMRRLDKLVADFPDLFKLVRQTDIDKTYEFPKKYALPKRPRVLSEEQREKMRDRLLKAREAKDTDDDEFEDDFEDEDDEEAILGEDGDE